MMKAKKSLIAGASVLGLTCCMAGSMLCTAIIPASAADAFAADSEGSAIFLGGQSEENILAALNAKVAEINEGIQQVLDAGGDLATAYAQGEILAYSIASGSNGLIDSDNKRSGWKVWDAAPLLDLKFINAGYGGWGDNYVSALQYDGVKDTAYLVTGEFAQTFYSSNNKLGTALSDAFAVTGADEQVIKYQNFTGGYIKSEGGSASVVWDKNVVVNEQNNGVNEVAADATATSYVGAPTSDVINAAGGQADSGKKVADAFVAAYEAYAEEGFNVGYPFSGVSTKYTLTTQDFRNGDSVSAPWGGDRSNWAFLAYNYEENKAYLIKDEFQYVFENGGSLQATAKTLGDPVGDDFVATDGNRYQNFANGYMKATGTEPQNANVAEVVIGKNVDNSGTASDISVADKIGKLGPSVTEEVIPDGYDADSLSAAFRTAYEAEVDYADGETLASVELVTYANGYLSQSFTDNNGAVHMLAYSAAIDDFVYFRPAVVSALSGSLGAPTDDRIEAAASDGQFIYAYPFANGYVRLTVSEQSKIEGGEVITVLNESAVATEGAVYDAEKNFFETVSYSDQIVPGMIKHESSGDNKSVDEAYWDIWGVEQPDDETIAGAFRTAYDEAFALGFSAGQPSADGILFWKSGNSGVIKLTLKGGNGNSNFWADNTLMTYNPYDGKVYITTGLIGNTYATDGASGNGWATTEMLVNSVTGTIVQQFDITDSVVTHRMIYIIVENGTASKVPGEYDFEANANGGQWTSYLAQFGGGISSQPVNPDPVKAGDTVTINFADYVSNDDGYYLTWNLLSEEGTLSDDGVFTLENAAAGAHEIQVEVYSAFDRLTFNVSVTAEDGGSQTPEGDPDDDVTDPTDPADPGKKGGSDNTGLIIGLVIGAVVIIAAVVVIVVVVRKKKKN